MKKIVSAVLACLACACCLGLLIACGEGEDAPAHTHTMTPHAAIEATCTQGGSVAYWECGGCGKVFADEAGKQELTDVAVPALGHDYVWKVTKAATCTEEGTRTGVCSRCDDEQTETIAALEHAFGAWAVVTPAGCESAGEEARACTRQGCTHKETRPLAALEHDYVWTVTKAATCTEEGTRTGACSRCDDEQTETIAALEHAFGAWEVVMPAGCKSAGEEARACTRQGCTYRETRPLTALGHNYVWTVTKAATCTEEGTRTGVCSRCDDEKTETIAALGGTHSYTLVQENGTYYNVCSRCGDKIELEAGDAEAFPFAVTAANSAEFVGKLSGQKALYVRLDGSVSFDSYLFAGAFGAGTGAVHIDLNGNPLSLTGAFALAVGRDLSMKNGTFSVPYGMTVGSGVSLNFSGVEVTASSATCFTVTGDSVLSFADDSTITSGVSGGKAAGYGIHVQASAEGARVSISGFLSSVQSFNEDYCGILFEAEGELSVSDGSVTGRGQGVVMRAGSATFKSARLKAQMATETFAGYSQDVATWGSGNQVAYGGLVACGTAQVKFVSSCYCVGDARVSATDPYKIGIYAYGEDVSVDFSEVTYSTVETYFVNFGDTATVTGYEGTVCDSWNGSAFVDAA